MKEDQNGFGQKLGNSFMSYGRKETWQGNFCLWGWHPVACNSPTRMMGCGFSGGVLCDAAGRTN